MKYVAIALIVALLAWLYLRRRETPPAVESAGRRVRAPASDQTAFHAVSIKSAADACEAAKALAGRRILSGEAPRLPLPNCDAPRCQCHFVHHDDRRRGRDRRNPFNPAVGTAGSGRYEAERRQGEERRGDDRDG